MAWLSRLRDGSRPTSSASVARVASSYMQCVPSEMFGAYMAVTSSLRGLRVGSPATQASASSSIAVPSDIPSDKGADDKGTRRFETDLDFKPRLSVVVKLLCWLLPPALLLFWHVQFAPVAMQLAEASWRRTAMWALSWLAKVATSVAVSGTLQCQLVQRQYSARERDGSALGDDDSLFRSVDGLLAHYKCAASGAASRAAPHVALYHGFGANLWSWGAVQAPLARALGGLVTAHDMPGFGLTGRSTRLSAYSLRMNGALGRDLLDAELAKRSFIPASSSGEEEQTGARGVTRILVGHSLGCAGIAEEVAARPEGIGGIILVAPALMTPPFLRLRLRTREIREDTHGVGVMVEQHDPHTSRMSESSDRDSSPVSPLAAQIAQAVDSAATKPPASRVPGWARSALHVLLPVIFIVLRPVIVGLERTLVRRKAFWVQGLRSAYCDKGKLTDDLVYRYRLPALCRGWETGIARFLEARVSGALAGEDDRQGDQLTRFKAAIDAFDIPVVIMHGEQDALVPIANSCRLSALLGAPLVKISECGHTPAEEVPECFIAEVERFVNGLPNAL